MRVILRIPDQPRCLLVETGSFEGEWSKLAKLLKAGVTQWMKRCPDGRRARIECRGVFTLQDLAAYLPDCFLRATKLGEILLKKGVPSSLNIEIIDLPPDAEALQGDTNLYEGGK